MPRENSFISGMRQGSSMMESALQRNMQDRRDKTSAQERKAALDMQNNRDQAAADQRKLENDRKNRLEKREKKDRKRNWRNNKQLTRISKLREEQMEGEIETAKWKQEAAIGAMKEKQMSKKSALQALDTFTKGLSAIDNSGPMNAAVWKKVQKLHLDARAAYEDDTTQKMIEGFMQRKESAYRKWQSAQDRFATVTTYNEETGATTSRKVSEKTLDRQAEIQDLRKRHQSLMGMFQDLNASGSSEARVVGSEMAQVSNRIKLLESGQETSTQPQPRTASGNDPAKAASNNDPLGLGLGAKK